MPQQFESFSVGDDTFPATTVTVPKPAGTVKGDLLIAWGMGTGSGAWTLPVGWTKSFQKTNTSREGFLGNLVAGPSEPGSYIFTFAGTDTFIVAIMRFSGNDLVNPVNAEQLFAQTDSNSPREFPCPPINTTVANTLIICLDMADMGGPIITGTLDRPGFTERVDSAGAVGFRPSVRAYTKDVLQADPGATGPTSTAVIVHLPDSGTHVGFVATLAIAPLLSGGGGGMGDVPLPRERLERGQKILNPFGTSKRHCMCAIGKCDCL